jgi:hypothetical protein
MWKKEEEEERRAECVSISPFFLLSLFSSDEKIGTTYPPAQGSDCYSPFPLRLMAKAIRLRTSPNGRGEYVCHLGI